MEILLIISPYSPAQSPNTLRWIPIMSQLKQKGHKLTVLTTKWSNTDKFSEQDDIRIYREGHHTLMDFVFNKLQSKNRRNIVGNDSYDDTPGVFRKLVESLVDKFWRNNYWPDGTKLFLKPGLKKAKEIVSKHSISHIISVGLPFTNHLIARQIKQEHSKIKWLMDIQDPFCYSKSFWVNNFEKYEAKNISEEGMAFDLADGIAITNPMAKKLYLDLFPSAKNKIRIIPPLFDPCFDSSKVSEYLAPHKIHLGYFGSFYQKVRSPKKFMMFLDHINNENPGFLDKLEFHFFGEQNKFSLPIFNQFSHLNKTVNFYGLKERTEVMAQMRHMDILLNFGNSTNYHLPSKVVDFLYFDKPIINFSINDTDTVDEFLSHKCRKLSLQLSQDKFAKQALEMETFIKNINSHRSTESLENIREYTPDVLARDYLDLLGLS